MGYFSSVVLSAVLIIWVAAGAVSAGETLPEAIPGEASEADDMTAEADSPGSMERDGPQHQWLMRELDREYQDGSLTRTEYIQRKRELRSLGE